MQKDYFIKKFIYEKFVKCIKEYSYGVFIKAYFTFLAFLKKSFEEIESLICISSSNN